jgi:hypothetical protein
VIPRRFQLLLAAPFLAAVLAACDDGGTSPWSAVDLSVVLAGDESADADQGARWTPFFGLQSQYACAPLPGMAVEGGFPGSAITLRRLQISKTHLELGSFTGSLVLDVDDDPDALEEVWGGLTFQTGQTLPPPSFELTEEHPYHADGELVFADANTGEEASRYFSFECRPGAPVIITAAPESVVGFVNRDGNHECQMTLHALAVGGSLNDSMSWRSGLLEWRALDGGEILAADTLNEFRSGLFWGDNSLRRDEWARSQVRRFWAPDPWTLLLTFEAESSANGELGTVQWEVECT